jgi:hypothetical protein
MSEREDSFIEELEAAMEVMDSPVVFDNMDGTSSIEDSDGSSVDNLNNESLEQFLSYARYGNEVKFGAYRHNRDFVVKDGKLFVQDKGRF